MRICIHSLEFLLYSGDEIGQLNDNDYHKDLEKAEDSRYIHRGKFQWELAEKVQEKGSVQERIFQGLKELSVIRASEKVFLADADCYTVETGDDSVLCVVREYKDEKMTCIFDFRNNNFQWIKEGAKDE